VAAMRLDKLFYLTLISITDEQLETSIIFNLSATISISNPHNYLN